MTEPLGIYIHVPFCAARCYYCDFATAPYDAGAAGRYHAALEEEMRAAAAVLGHAAAYTVYVGGVTPTTLGAGPLAEILDTVRRTFQLAADAEVSVEANPETVTTDLCRALAAAGVNRLSLGVQTFDDALLHTIGRRHDAAGARRAFGLARDAGVANLSLDLIYGLPGQTFAGWRGDVEEALALAPDHLSLYALTLEPGVPLARRRGLYTFPADDELAAMYYAAADTLTAAGFEHYEISNFARAGRACRHNLKYWRDREYVAFGPSAASHLRGRRYKNPRDLDEYVKAAGAGRWPPVAAEPSDAAREMRTAAVLGLRLIAGLDLASFRRRFRTDFLEYYGRDVTQLAADALFEIAGGVVRLTRRGLFLSDEVFSRLI